MDTTLTTKAQVLTTASEWVHPGTGAKRYYLSREVIDALLALGGLEVTFKRSGYVDSCTVNGETLSNSKGQKLVGSFFTSMKVWVNEDGTLGVKDATSEVADFLKEGFSKLADEDEPAEVALEVPAPNAEIEAEWEALEVGPRQRHWKEWTLDVESTAAFRASGLDEEHAECENCITKPGERNRTHFRNFIISR